LLITSGATLLIANIADLSSISTMGSAGFLLIFAAVNGANVKLAGTTRSRKWISLLGAMLCLAALTALVWQTAKDSPWRIWVLIVLVIAAFSIEAGFRLIAKRRIRLFRGKKPIVPGSCCSAQHPAGLDSDQ
jgi:hypothetical protein